MLQNNTLINRIIRKSKKLLGFTPGADNARLAILIEKYANKKSFADIGCMWGVNGFNSFLAEEKGATRVVAVDVYPESKEFLAEKTRRNSKIEFVDGDINLKETVDKIGQCDVVLCSGVLYHTPDPVHLLTHLRAITKETLILGTASIPERSDMKNTAVFYPYLDENQRKVWNRGVGSQKAITGPYEPEEGYANWFWGFTPSCVESMLNCAGFEVTERYVSPFLTFFVCRTVPTKLVAESGKWTTPSDKDFIKFKR